MTKRIPKSQGFSENGFELTWITVSYHTGRAFQGQAYYKDEQTAKLALEIASSQKTKESVNLRRLTPCPDSLEIQQLKMRDSGAEWDHRHGRYMYSASY